MNITILTVGKIKENFYKEAVSEYSKRLSKYCKLNIIEVEDEKTAENMSDREISLVLEEEGRRLLKYVKPSAYVMALCIEGKKLDSVEFSRKIGELALSGNPDLCFVIGGSLGLSSEIKKRADLKLSFSDMTFPHQLMRVILTEQIYRAFRIMKNEPYHK